MFPPPALSRYIHIYIKGEGIDRAIVPSSAKASAKKSPLKKPSITSLSAKAQTRQILKRQGAWVSTLLMSKAYSMSCMIRMG